VLTHGDIRALALALPETVEADHHGRPSFRVGGKIFATLWDATHLNAMLDEDGIRTAVADHPDVCEPVHWGKRLAAVRLDLAAAATDRALASELLTDAWENRAGRLRDVSP
jgi:hypothetical protein